MFAAPTGVNNTGQNPFGVNQIPQQQVGMGMPPVNPALTTLH